MEQMSPMLQAYIEQQQAIGNPNKNNNVQYVDLTQKPDTFEYSNKQEEKNNKGKIAKIIAIGAAIAATAAGIIYAVKKGKAINLSDMTPDKFKQIQTDKFTGKIKGKLKNGDKIVMEYVDGVLQKSTRKGNVNFEKVYETINNEKIVKKTVNGVTTEFNITKTQQEVKVAQEKLKNILSDKNLSSDELKKQTDAIKFKSNNQKQEIENAINSKKKAEAELKAKLKAEEKAKIEAQKKQEELDKIAKAKAEEAAKEKLAKQDAAEKLRQQEIAKAESELNKQIDNFTASFTNKTDAELEQMRQSLCNEIQQLSKSDQQKYKLVDRKLDALCKEQRARRYKHLDGILRKPEDKPVKALHMRDYGTAEEIEQMYIYYDNYRCNSALRGQGGAINVDLDLMDSLFKKAPALKEEAVVYRSIPVGFGKSRSKFVDSFKDGFIIDDPAFISTATKIDDRQFYQFAGRVAEKDTDGVLMRIRLPKGTKGVLGGHNEYLLPRNSKIKVNKLNLIDGIKVADCEYILPN